MTQKQSTTVPHPAIEVIDLHRGFGHGSSRVRAVDGVSLTVGSGEIVALLGSNGAGKTTTIDTILGFGDPDAGTVRVLGGSPRAAIGAGRISAVLQTGGLLADLTVAETVTVIAGLCGAADRIDDTMARAGLTALAKRRVSKCSGGEQQRIKFALALLPDPDVLILDEPTAGMDVVARRRFWEVMKHEADAGRTIMFATHYLEEAEQFARRTIVMHAGRVVADAPTTELRASLGGRVLSITMTDLDAAVAAERELRDSDDIDEVTRDGVRLTIRATDTDTLAAHMLRAGGVDLEIVAPTLETAFSVLTEEVSA